MEFSGTDEKIKCIDCSQEFLFTVNDQQFFKDKGFTAPKRCKACRQAKKEERAGNPNNAPAAQVQSYSEPWQDEQRGGGRGKKKHARGRR